MEFVKTREKKTEESKLNTTVTTTENLGTAVVSPPLARRTNQDFPGLGRETKDVLKQLNAHIDCLEDLEGRLIFVLGEVRSLVRRT